MKARRIAVVVGATGAIGRSVCHVLLQRECAVALVGRDQLRLRELEESLPENGADRVALRADVRDSASVAATARAAHDRYGSLHILVYAVGRTPDVEVPLASYPIAEWRNTLDTYLTGFLVCFQSFLPLMESGGHIVVLSSAITRFTTATLPPFHAGHYAAAKAALDTLCTWARREAHARGVLLSRIAPSAVDTAHHRQAPPERRPLAVVPMNRLCERVVSAIEDRKELDEIMIGEAPLSTR